MSNLPFGIEAFEYLTDAIVIVDNNSNVVYVNKSATKLYDVSNEDVLGKKLSDLFTEEWIRPADKLAYEASLAEKGVWSGENFHIKKSGHKFHVLASLTVFHDSLGKKRGIIFTIRQIGEFQLIQEHSNAEKQFRLKMNSASSPDLNIDKQELANLIDAKALQSMMDDLYAVTKIGFAIIDLKGNVLAGAGWQDICLDFHRVNPQTLWNCLESDLVLTQGVPQGEFRTYKCKNNMWDIVTPIIIGKKHVGNLFSGQFFFDDENIDKDLFAKQAEKYGFDKDAYLSALDRVPRWNRTVVKNLMQFYAKLSEMISNLSHSNLKLSKSLTDQKTIERELRKIQHDLTHAQDVAKTGSWRLNVQSNELSWSDETYKLFGIPKGTPLKYETFLENVHPEDKQLVDKHWKAALRGEKYDVEHRIIVNGEVFWVREKAELEFSEDGSLLGGFGTVQDITEHKINQQKLHRLNRGLRAISNANQALMRATDEVAFLQQGCRIIVEDCGYTLVWIGFAENDVEKTVKPMAYAGFDKGYIESLKITWADTERGRGPTGTAIRTGKPQICRDMSADPNFSPWLKQAAARGYSSSIVLPLMSQGKAFGALNIYSKELDPFSEDEVKLLYELASDFSHGIMLLRMRSAKEQAEKALINASDQVKLAMEASNLGAWDYRLDTGDVFWDARTRDMFGVPEGSQIKYDEAIKIIHPDDRLATDEALKKVVAGENDGNYYREFRVVWPDGSIHWVASRGKVYFSGEGIDRKAVRFTGVNMEITERKVADLEIARLASFPELNPNPVVEVDSDYKVQYANPAAKAMFSEALMSSCHPLLADLEKVVQALRTTNNRSFGREIQVGESSYYQTFSLVPNSERVRLYALNIDNLKKAEKALRESEQRWATTLSSIGDAVIATDLDGKITFMNAISEKLTGWTQTDGYQKPIREVFNIVNEQTRAEVENPVIKVLQKGQIVNLANHTMLIRKDGTEIPIDDSGAPIKSNDGKTVGVVLVFREITARKKNEEALKKAEKEWERTFDAVPHMIAILDTQHRIKRVNKAMANRLGAKPEQCVGLLCYECVHGTKQPPEFCPLTQTIKDGEPHTAEVHEKRLGGDVIVSTTPIMDEHGKITGSVHIARDTQR